MITSALPDGFRIREGHAAFKHFASLEAIISHYAFVLKSPFRSSITAAEWFHGDLSSSETEELLADSPLGTFLVRFSAVRPGTSRRRREVLW